MKKTLLLVLLSSFLSNAQTTIVEETLGKDKPKFKYDYSFQMNKIIISEAFENSLGGGIFNRGFMCDENGKKEIIIENDKFTFLELSDNGVDFLSIYLEKKLGPLSAIYYSNDEKYNFGNIKNYLNNFDFYKNFFTNQFQLRIVDSQGKKDLEFEKDAFYLQKTDYTKKISKSIQIKKPNFQRLKGENLLKIKNIGCRAKIVDNNSFELITKSISKDLVSSTLYRTIYDLEGKIINDYKYPYTLASGHLVRCTTRKGESSFHVQPKNAITKSTEFGVNGPLLDLDINEHFIDPVTKDVYIYGVYMDEFPAGFYLIRYTNEGEKIWEKQYSIQDKKGFNKKHQTWSSVHIYLHKYMNENSLSVSVDGLYGVDGYNHFFVIDKEKGEVKRQESKDADRDVKGGFLSLTRSSVLESINVAKNRYCEVNTLLAYTLNQKVKKYIDGIVSKKEIYIDSFITSKGIWLVESDNDNYYKVTLFKD